ncbi:Phosphoheptose isomerase [Marinobacterium lacunae]|uniref:Phosphoheptose isomerase n=1 Tax=Marinobacterium lacunae TaxID=1232683 RepID=A0A081G3P6_9GAMM|nr:SIS domain-containing protein [Marinobacterium lacunae]KEA65401.1 Phosphoheptose isomerase [Marinobacterium lacunae]MBR9885293.1 SIS domain-containing protein [Oceanospirillales bacterium]
MELEDRIVSQFHNSMEINAQTIEHYTPLIAEAGELLLHCLVNESKILCVGNGGAGALSQHFTALLLSRFRHERPGLPALALNADSAAMSAITEDSSFAEVYAKQIRALGQPGDILLAISPDGRGTSLVQAIQAAHDREMQVIALTGGDGGNMTALLARDEIEICVPSDDEALVYDAQLLVLHCLCDLIDYQLFGA